MKITERTTDFAKLSAEKKHTFFQKMWEFDQKIFPNASIDDLYNELYDLDAVSIPVIHYYHQGMLVGQNIIQILKLKLNDYAIFVVSSRAGFLPEYRRRNLTLNSAIRVAVRHRLRYPTHPLWFVSTLMQPKVYTLFASRSRYFYPRRDKAMPKDHQQVLQMIQMRKHGVQKRGEDIYIHPCDMPKVTPEQLIRLRNKSDRHVQFFMQHVPDYFDGMGLMCVCRLDLKTIIETTYNLTSGRAVN